MPTIFFPYFLTEFSFHLVEVYICSSFNFIWLGMRKTIMVVKFYGWFSRRNRNNRDAAYEQLLDLISRQLLIKKGNEESRLLINFSCKKEYFSSN